MVSIGKLYWLNTSSEYSSLFKVCEDDDALEIEFFDLLPEFDDFLERTDVIFDNTDDDDDDTDADDGDFLEKLQHDEVEDEEDFFLFKDENGPDLTLFISGVYCTSQGRSYEIELSSLLIK